MTQYAVCYTLENPPPGAELVCFNRLTGGDTPAETLAKIKAAAAAAAVKDVAGKAAPPPTAPAPAPVLTRPRQHRRPRRWPSGRR